MLGYLFFRKRDFVTTVVRAAESITISTIRHRGLLAAGLELEIYESLSGSIGKETPNRKKQVATPTYGELGRPAEGMRLHTAFPFEKQHHENS